jgi:hypothetical protein
LGLQIALDRFKDFAVGLDNADQSIGLAAGFRDDGFEILFDGCETVK